MGQDPREAWRALQRRFQQSSGGRPNFPGGGPRFMGLGGGALLLFGGFWFINNALFNGKSRGKLKEGHMKLNEWQSTVVTGQ